MKKMMQQKRDIPTFEKGKQVYDNYSDEDQLVWQILFDRQIKNLPNAASQGYIQGLASVGFVAESIPDFNQTNEVLREATGWELVAVDGIVDDQLFFQLLSEKKFPATTWLRSMAELDYLEEPDMFHDVFAHVPLLVNQSFVDFLQALAALALEHLNDAWAIELISRIYWFTIEFGLITEKEGLRIYGAGILSSAGETKFSLSETPNRFDYDVRTILGTGFRKDTFQENYFIVTSYGQLYNSIDVIRDELNAKLAEIELINR